MCCPCGRELYSTRELNLPSTPPQSAAAPYRRKVVSPRLGGYVDPSVRVVGDGRSWQIYPNSTARADLRGWVSGT